MQVCWVGVRMFHQRLIMVPGLTFAAVGKRKEHGFLRKNEANTRQKRKWRKKDELNATEFR